MIQITVQNKQLKISRFRYAEGSLNNEVLKVVQFTTCTKVSKLAQYCAVFETIFAGLSLGPTVLASPCFYFSKFSTANDKRKALINTRFY